MSTVLVFTGEYDLDSKQQLRNDFEAVASEPVLICDFTDVSYIDSTCLNELLRLQKIRAQYGLEPVAIVLRPDGAIRRLMEITGVSEVARLFDARAAALDGQHDGPVSVVIAAPSPLES